MSRVLLILIALLVCFGAPSWGSDPATPAAMAADYPKQPPAPGQPVAPAVQAGIHQADLTATPEKHWWTDAGTVVMAAGLLVVGVLERNAPALIARFLPMAGPYGGLIQLVLQGILWLVKPAVQKKEEQLQADHAEMGRAIVTTIQGLSNSTTIQALKARFEANLDPTIRTSIDDLVKQLEEQGIDHDTHGSDPAPVVAAAK